jgi:hypothetical protein
MASNPAETYERYMVPPLFAPSAELLVDAAAPAAGERVGSPRAARRDGSAAAPPPSSGSTRARRCSR